MTNNTKNIIRRAKENRYTTICNDIYNDNRLDMKARGIHTYILTKPDTWTVVVEDIIKSGLDGEKAIRSGINLLVKLRYWQRYKLYDEKNRILCGETIVYETPYTEEETIKRAKLSADGKSITYFYENGTQETIENDLNIIERYRNKKLQRENHLNVSNKMDKPKTSSSAASGRKKSETIIESTKYIKELVNYDQILEDNKEFLSNSTSDKIEDNFIAFVDKTIEAAAALISDDKVIIQDKEIEKGKCYEVISILTYDLIVEFYEGIKPKLKVSYIKNIHGFLKTCLYNFLNDYDINKANISSLETDT